MSQPPASTLSLPLAPPGPRFDRLSADLLFAWDRSDPKLLGTWSLDAAKTFGVVLGRRSMNVVKVASQLGKMSWAEVRAATAAFQREELQVHLGARASEARTSGTLFIARAKESAAYATDLLRSQPRAAIPQLLTLVVASLLVSGGPGGNGGAPDLDLMFGIGAHRSILSHSILMGAALETAFLSLVDLVRLIHAQLPKEHDPIWDTVMLHASSIATAASTGASLGMSYHLMVDGLLQPAAYHDLPISLPIEGHQAILVGNSVAEALDVGHKAPPTRVAKPQRPAKTTARRPPTASRTGRTTSDDVSRVGQVPTKDELAHQNRRREHFSVDPSIARMLSDSELRILENYGSWMKALASGALTPLSKAQSRFVLVAQGKISPVTEHERVWRIYSELASDEMR